MERSGHHHHHHHHHLSSDQGSGGESTVTTTSSATYIQAPNYHHQYSHPHSHPHASHPHHPLYPTHPHSQYVYAAPGVRPPSCGPEKRSPTPTQPSVVSHAAASNVRKKPNSLRNGDVLKRSRGQAASYELSQDLLEKQIEMLERKYGGVRARNAALTIQRAFRHYMLVKKFAAITASAKAEKRISRRMQDDATDHRLGGHDRSAGEYVDMSGQNRTLPTRSMSLRERRSIDSTPFPRSQSGGNGAGGHETCWDSASVHYCEPGAAESCSRSGPMSGSSNSGAGGGSVGGMMGGRPSSRVPPEVPKRTSSISTAQARAASKMAGGDNGSMSSMQSSGSDSSISTERPHCDSPVWKRKSNSLASSNNNNNINSSSCSGSMLNASPQPSQNEYMHISNESNISVATLSDAAGETYKLSETIRKRQYRVGLNLFNKKPEKGVAYLIRRGFLESSPQGVARFLISRKGLSKQMIGEYLGNLQSTFCMAVLECFARELDLSGMQVDVALRKFQGYFRMPGEAQKIERLMEVFSQRYCECNYDVVARLRSPDTVFVLAFAIIMLNTDLHTPNIKPERRMRLEDFIKNLRGIDNCEDIDAEMLAGIYDRVKASEFKPGSDHVTQVMKVQATIVGKKPNMALPHRRLVCYCRLYEIPDVNKRERPGVHQREVFLFNDLLVITKIFSKKKSSVTYTFRHSFPLCGMVVTLFEAPHYPYGIRLSQRVDSKTLITFNARNEHDRCKFAEDLRESISEMDEMESLRIEAELERQKSNRAATNNGNGTSSSTNSSSSVRTSTSDNRDSGVADVEICPCSMTPGGESAQLKRSALSNSLLDMHDQFTNDKVQRRGSVGSLDSGMSVSFQSSSASSCSRAANKLRLQGHSQQNHNHNNHSNSNPSFLGGLFNKKDRKSDDVAKSTQV